MKNRFLSIVCQRFTTITRTPLQSFEAVSVNSYYFLCINHLWSNAYTFTIIGPVVGKMLYSVYQSIIEVTRTPLQFSVNYQYCISISCGGNAYTYTLPRCSILTKEQLPSVSWWSTRDPGSFKTAGNVVMRFWLRNFCCSRLRITYSG